MGPDGISACFLKEVADPIAAPLTKLYNNLWKLVLFLISGSVSMLHQFTKGDHVIIQVTLDQFLWFQ